MTSQLGSDKEAAGEAVGVKSEVISFYEESVH